MTERLYHKVVDWTSPVGVYCKEFIAKCDKFTDHCKEMSKKYGEGNKLTLSNFELLGVAVSKDFKPQEWQKVRWCQGHLVLSPNGSSKEAKEMRADFKKVRKPDNWDFSDKLPGYEGVLAFGSSLFAASFFGAEDIGYVVSIPVNSDTIDKYSKIEGCELMSTKDYIIFTEALSKK